MARVIVPLAPGFEEIEAVTVIDILRRAGVDVVVAGLVNTSIAGSHGISISADALLDDVMKDEFEMVVLPGGQPGTTNLHRDERVRALLQRVADRGGYTTAICAAPMVLAAMGISIGHKVTSHPSVRESLRDHHYREDRVVIDERVITSRGAGTAVEFALKLVEVLCGKEKAETISEAIVFE